MEKPTERSRGDLTHIVNFRASNDHVLRLKALAVIRNTSASEVLRKMISTEAVRQVGGEG